VIRVRVFDHPFEQAQHAPREFETDSLGNWLIATYGEHPQFRVQVFAGEPATETEITGDIAAILQAGQGGCRDYTVLVSPGVDVVGDVIDFSVDITLGLLGKPLIDALFPKPPDVPSNVRRTQQSQNNALGSRENKVRLLERVEDIFGTVKSIPSLMMPTYRAYIDHRQYEYGYYCIGRGYYELAEIRDGDSLLSNITGASAAVYEPFTSPNAGIPVLQIGDAIDDAVVTVARADQVDGVTLRALNQVQLPTSASYTFVPDAAGDRIIQAAKTPNFNSVCVVGDTLVIVASITETTGDWHDVDHNIVAQEGADHFHITSSTTTTYSGTYTVSEVGDGFVRVSTSTWSVSKSITDASIQVSGKTEWSDWVTLSDLDRTQVWINVLAPGGLYKDNGGLSTAAVEYRIEIENIPGPGGASMAQAEHATISGATTDERASTLRITTTWTGPARVRVKRVTQFDYGFDGRVQDEIKWLDLYAVSPVAAEHFGNKTTIHTVTRATLRSTSIKARQLNCLASRKLPTWDGTGWSGAFDATGRHASGTIAATSRIIDILAALTIDPLIGRRSIDELDVAQVWAVQQALDAWHAEVGQFNYTLDSDGISFEETVHMVANAAFCTAYRQSGKIRLALDRAQEASTALFTHRNKRPRAESVTRTFATDADHDGVELTYVDPDSAVPETISLPLTRSAGKPLKIELPGIRSFAQAWLRANREYYRLTLQRLAIETETTMDARLIVPNARIDIVDNTRFRAFDGEVLAQEGLTLRLSREVAFSPGQSHSIVLMRRDGGLQSIACTAGSTPDRVLLSRLPDEAVVTQYGAAGIRTIFSFAADDARAAQAWLVQEIDLSDSRYAKVIAINYTPNYYQADALAIPPKASVIN
jgi:hypothetical protein